MAEEVDLMSLCSHFLLSFHAISLTVGGSVIFREDVVASCRGCRCMGAVVCAMLGSGAGPGSLRPSHEGQAGATSSGGAG